LVDASPVEFFAAGVLPSALECSRANATPGLSTSINTEATQEHLPKEEATVLCPAGDAMIAISI
jgi:hypothetical protein